MIWKAQPYTPEFCRMQNSGYAFIEDPKNKIQLCIYPNFNNLKFYQSIAFVRAGQTEPM